MPIPIGAFCLIASLFGWQKSVSNEVVWGNPRTLEAIDLGRLGPRVVQLTDAEYDRLFGK